MSKKFYQRPENVEESKYEHVAEVKEGSVSDAEALDCFTKGMVRLVGQEAIKKSDVDKRGMAIDLYMISKDY